MPTNILHAFQFSPIRATSPLISLEGLGKLKNPPHPGLEPATFQLAA
jgi:hypothetical protein